MSVSKYNGIMGSIEPEPAPIKYPVLPVVLLLDVSNSMNTPLGTGRTRMQELLGVLGRLEEELNKVGEARRGGELCVVSFGGNGVERLDLRPQRDHGLAPTFVKLSEAQIPNRLEASGHTPLAEALDEAAEIVETRNQQLAKRPRYRANVWIITDGQNTDAERGMWTPIPARTIDRLRRLEQEHIALLFTVKLPGSDDEELERLTPNSTFPVDNANFREITNLIAVSSGEAGNDPDEPADDIYRRIGNVMGR